MKTFMAVLRTLAIFSFVYIAISQAPREWAMALAGLGVALWIIEGRLKERE